MSSNLIIVLLLLILSGTAIGESQNQTADGARQVFNIPWYSVSSGGTLKSSVDHFELSGTIGQWDATEARSLSGGQWKLTGGFWGLTLEALGDLLFSDRFEIDADASETAN